MPLISLAFSDLSTSRLFYKSVPERYQKSELYYTRIKRGGGAEIEREIGVFKNKKGREQGGSVMHVGRYIDFATVTAGLGMPVAELMSRSVSSPI